MMMLNYGNSQYNKEGTVKRAIIRFKVILGFKIFCFFIIILRLFDLGFTNPEELLSAQIKDLRKKHVVSRGDILDRNGALIASNIKAASVYAHPKQIIHIRNAARQISNLNIGITEKDLLTRLSSGKDFVWIKRHITPAEQQIIHDLGIPGIYFAQDEKRVYPHENLFSHVVGYVGVDGFGMAGLERLYDDELIANGKEESKTLHTSLDVRVQNILHTELKSAVESNEAIGGSGIVMNVNTGEILAMCSIPDFNPNTFAKEKQRNFFNQATLGTYEPGSIAKAITVAIALDLKLIQFNDAFDVSSALRVGKFSIRDYRGRGGFLSVPEILMYSSNIGTGKIARLIGIKNQREYLNRFGLLSEVTGTVPEKAKPIYPNERNWMEASLITIGFGHGIAVTSLHMAQAIAAVVNGGLLYKSTLIKQNGAKEIEHKRVLKEQTSHLMRKILRKVVAEGSGFKADVKGLVIGGKTGTSEKNKNGRYNRKLNIASFAGVFPMHNPEYIVLVVIDEAKPNNYNAGYTSGGSVAAPVAGNIIKKMAQVLNTHYYEYDDKEVMQAMYLDYTPRRITKIAAR